jgi:cytochrome c biogenesis protein CcdA/thiol-disulfide isomerase/thioredoxin
VGELLAIAFLGGFITGVSPCIVPVLPVVVAGGSTGSKRARPFLIIAGLVLSFSLAELLGTTILSALGLPQDLLFWLGISVLLILALGLLVPTVGYWTERPFSRLGASRHAGAGGGFVLGLSLGLVFVPCAGPVLAAISVAAANHRVSASSLFVTLFYAAGAAVPLLVFCVLAQRAASGWQRLRRHLPAVRRLAGAVLALTTLAIAVGLFDPLQRDVPGYTSALENQVEGSSSVSSQLQALSGEHANSYAKKQQAAAKASTAKAAAAAKASTAKASAIDGPVLKVPAAAPGPAAFKKVRLPELGAAANFAGIVSWLNTPGDRPLSLAQLRGKVVLVDFWTYSCINCQRSLPHVEAWYNDYKKDGFVVVGVHTPEFAFEHVLSNVRSAVHSLGVDYPVAVDSNYGTWDAYNNEYWPADYLIDPTGQVRVYDYGEGGYSKMETDIRELLTANGAVDLPPRTDVANQTPTQAITQESYLGYNDEEYAAGQRVVPDKAVDYHAPASVPTDSFAFNGVWTDHKEEATAGANAEITLNFTANDVYLVMGGTGMVDVSLNGRHLASIDVAGVPRLYTLLSGVPLVSGELQMSFASGVQAYDFTFG